jgi:hypothetical protein
MPDTWKDYRPQSEFAVVGDDFGLDGLEFRSEPDKGSPGTGTKNRVAEECVETMLALHFEQIFGTKPIFVLRSRAMQSEADVVAMDVLGRVHIVEVKQGERVTAQVVRQAIQYAYRFLFVDPWNHFCEQARRSNTPATASRFALWFAALHAGVQTKTLGPAHAERLAARTEFRDKIAKYFQRGVTATEYRKLKPDEEDHVDAEIAFELARRRKTAKSPGRRLKMKSYEELLEIGRRWAERTCIDAVPSDLASSDRAEPWFRAIRPLVLWVVGKEVTQDAVEELQRLRGLGVDARGMEVEVRSRPHETRWHLRVWREDAKERDMLERKVAERARQEGFCGRRRPWLSLRIYDERSPSDKSEDVHGQLLDAPQATFWGGGTEGGGHVSTRVPSGLVRAAEMLQSTPEALEDRLMRIAVRAAARDWSRVQDQLGRPSEGPDDLLRWNDHTDTNPGFYRSGRIGLHLLDPWLPGLFVGVLADPRDTGAQASQPTLGADFVCMVSFSWARGRALDGGHRRIIQETIKNLDRRLKRDAVGWDVHAQLKPRTAGRWHAIQLRRPLVQVFAGLTSDDAHTQRWLDAANEGLDAILRGGELQSLVAALADAEEASAEEASGVEDT